MTHADDPKDLPSHAAHDDAHDADAHGHGGHGHGQELPFQIIPEGSHQDSFLMLLAVVGLIGWLVFGFDMMTAPRHEVAESGHSSPEGAPAHE